MWSISDPLHSHSIPGVLEKEEGRTDLWLGSHWLGGGRGMSAISSNRSDIIWWSRDCTMCSHHTFIFWIWPCLHDTRRGIIAALGRRSYSSIVHTVLWCVLIIRRSWGPSSRPNTPGWRESTPSLASLSLSSPSQTNSVGSWCLCPEYSSW